MSAALVADNEQRAQPEPCPDDVEQIGRASGCEGCPGQEFCLRVSSAGKSEEQKMLETRMSVVKHKLIVMSGKGGVGKSTMASQLANGLVSKGFKVGLLDLDICGPSIPKMFGCEDAKIVQKPWGWQPVEVNGIKLMSASPVGVPVVWRGPRKTQMITRFLKDTFWGQLDYLVIDTPPGTSDEHLTVVNALKNANPDGGIIVTSPQEVSLDTIRKEISFCEKMKLPIVGILENLSGFACPCCGEIYDVFLKNGGKKIAEEKQLTFLGQVPVDPTISSLGENSLSFVDQEETSGFSAIDSVIQNILKALNSRDYRLALGPHSLHRSSAVFRP